MGTGSTSLTLQSPTNQLEVSLLIKKANIEKDI